MLYFIITLSNTLQGVELEKLNANKEADWKPASFFMLKIPLKADTIRQEGYFLSYILVTLNQCFFWLFKPIYNASHKKLANAYATCIR